jgi:hypothetical protein
MNARNRLINFRVTDEEFQRLKIASSLRNARSMSDFARSAILETAHACESAADPSGPLSGQLQSFDRRLTRLESGMSRIFVAIAEAGSLAAESKSAIVNSEG